MLLIKAIDLEEKSNKSTDRRNVTMETQIMEIDATSCEISYKSNIIINEELNFLKAILITLYCIKMKLLNIREK